jgi:AcrR family transcriptional regulator
MLVFAPFWEFIWGLSDEASSAGYRDGIGRTDRRGATGAGAGLRIDLGQHGAPVNVASTPAPKRVDGRRLRAERTRQRLIDAYLGLAFERSPRMPTAAEIAERAGSSLRSVFGRFPDLHNLQVAATIHAIDRVAALTPTPLLGTDRKARIEHHVETRANLCEIWGRLWRSLLVNRGDSDELRQKISEFQELRLRQLEVAFRPDLATLSDVDLRQTLVAVLLLTDASSWNYMRELLGLSVDEARAVWVASIQRLLPSTPQA